MTVIAFRPRSKRPDESAALRSCATCKWQRPASEAEPFARCVQFADHRSAGRGLAHPLVEEALASPRLCGGGNAWAPAWRAAD